MSVLSGSPAYAAKTEFQVINEFKAQEGSPHPDTLIDRPRFEYSSSHMRDPFQGLITKDEQGGEVKVSETVEVKPPVMTVQGVIWGGAFPQAIINNQLVQIGDETKEGVTITGINAYGVTFVFSEKEYTAPAPAVQELSE